MTDAMSIGHILDGLRRPEARFRPVAFWFLNHHPEPDELRRQIRAMADQAFGGIMLHARNGLRGGYLNRHWEQTVRCCIDEARSLGLDVYLYDELHYPSGHAGKQLFEAFPDTAMKYLELVFEGDDNAWPEGNPAFDLLLRVRADGRVERIPAGERPDREAGSRLLGFRVYETPEYPDYLDADAMREFVRLSYRWYADRFSADFGDVVKGEFTDNACANFGFIRRSIPWTPSMPEAFKARTGIDLDQVIPSLFIETPGFRLNRIRFWQFLNALFLDTFIVPIERECSRNGIAATGHYCIEEGTSEHVRQLGDRFDQKRRQHLPGVDMLGARAAEELETLIAGKAMPLAIPMTASPAYFVHDSRVLCECFGLSGEWAMTLADMYRIGGFLSALGVDLFVPHGLYYSIAGHRKRECVPDFLHNTLWEHIGDWCRWTGRLCSLTACSEHVAETAILYPALSQQATIELGAGAGGKDDRGEPCRLIDLSMRAAAEALLQNGIGYEMLDEALLESAIPVRDELHIPRPGDRRHPIRTVVLPSMSVVRASSWETLRRFSDAGGVVITLNEPPAWLFDGQQLTPVPEAQDCRTHDFRFGASAELAASSFPTVVAANRKIASIGISGGGGKIVVREWIQDGRRFAMLHNTSRSAIPHVDVRCAFPSQPVSIDLHRVASETPDCSGGPGAYVLKHDFGPGETWLLTPGDDDEASPAPPRVSVVETLDLREGIWRVELESPNTLRIPDCRVVESGRSWTYEFTVAEMPEGDLGVALDLEPSDDELRKSIHPFSDFWFCASGTMVNRRRVACRINGVAVRDIRFGSRFDRWIYEGDATGLVRQGRNTVEIEKPNSLLEWNAIPDSVMIFGRFGVRDGAIVRAPDALPSLRWDEGELAAYSGAIVFRRSLTLPESMRGRALRLLLEHVHEIAELSVNGAACGVRAMPPWEFDIPAPAKDADGRLDLVLRLINTPHNRWTAPRVSGATGFVALEAPGGSAPLQDRKSVV